MGKLSWQAYSTQCISLIGVGIILQTIGETPHTGRTMWGTVIPRRTLQSTILPRSGCCGIAVHWSWMVFRREMWKDHLTCSGPSAEAQISVYRFESGIFVPCKAIQMSLKVLLLPHRFLLLKFSTRGSSVNKYSSQAPELP